MAPHRVNNIPPSSKYCLDEETLWSCGHVVYIMHHASGCNEKDCIKLKHGRSHCNALCLRCKHVHKHGYSWQSATKSVAGMFPNISYHKDDKDLVVPKKQIQKRRKEFPAAEGDESDSELEVKPQEKEKEKCAVQ